MKINKNGVAYDRLRTCIIADKGGAIPRDVLDVLRRDLKDLLSQYFEMDSLAADMDYDKHGQLWLNVYGMVDRVRPFEPVAEVR